MTLRRWIARGGDAPVARLGTTDGPWTSPAGVVVFANRAAIASAPAVGITWDQTGAAISGGGTVLWTGVRADGAVGPNCANWDSQSGQGIVGKIGSASAAWTEESTGNCSGTGRVLCLER